jgi:hypothetical protein
LKPSGVDEQRFVEVAQQLDRNAGVRLGARPGVAGVGIGGT